MAAEISTYPDVPAPTGRDGLAWPLVTNERKGTPMSDREREIRFDGWVVVVRIRGANGFEGVVSDYEIMSKLRTFGESLARYRGSGWYFACESYDHCGDDEYGESCCGEDCCCAADGDQEVYVILMSAERQSSSQNLPPKPDRYRDGCMCNDCMPYTMALRQAAKSSTTTTAAASHGWDEPAEPVTTEPASHEPTVWVHP